MENDNIIVNQAANVTVADDDDMEQFTAVVTSVLVSPRPASMTILLPHLSAILH